MADFVEFRDISIEPTTKVVKKEVYAKYMEADELVSKAYDEAKQIQKMSSARYKKQKQDAKMAGLEEAKIELDKKMIDLSNKAIENLKGIEQSVADVVSCCVKSIIGDIDNERLIAKVVAKKIVDLQQGKSFTVTVNPVNDEQAIRRYLVDHLGIENFSLKHNVSLQTDQLIIDAALGAINTTIEREVLMVTDEVKESSFQLGRAI